MAGGYDQNILRTALDYVAPIRDGVELVTIGSQGHNALLRRGMTISADWSQLNEHVQMDDIAPIAGYLLRGFREGTFDRVAVAYTQFHGTARFRPTVRVLLPVALSEPPRPRQFYFEPDPVELIETLLPRVIQSIVHLALLESLAAEHAARAVAMRSAGTNAQELSDHLRLTYNKTRQATITAEMNEVSSALALRLGS
jgi:F-type H+-transporting ATPase subunit gamma